MPFAGTRIDIDIDIILSEVSETETQISDDITYTWNLNNDGNEITYKTELGSQT